MPISKSTSSTPHACANRKQEKTKQKQLTLVSDIVEDLKYSLQVNKQKCND